MFAFLIAPQRFIFNPLARRDRHMLRQQAQGRPLALRLLPYLLLTPFLILAFLPTQIYFTREQLPLLGLITASSVFLSILVGLRTLALAGHLMAREQGVGQWEQLIMTRMDARQIVLSKWCAVLPAAWFWHIMVALTRLGVALGFAQVFHHDFLVWECPFDAILYCNTSHYDRIGNFPAEMGTALWKIVLAFFALVVFSLLEATLLSAIANLSVLLAKGSSLRRLLLGMGMRGVLFLLGASLLYGSGFNHQFIENVRAKPTGFGEPFRSSIRNDINEDWQLLIETAEIGGLGMADNGAATAIGIMRPAGSRIYVLRQLVGAAIGMSLFVMLIWLTLRMAVWVAVRQRALRPGYI